MATFILVHGTFAKKASWPALEAGLIQTVDAVYECANFERVVWTGKNRARARQTAADDIFSVVEKVRATSASEKIFVIGHSHGGSAIAYFLKKYSETAKSLSGCAFLSTPFVAIRPRANAFALYYSMTIFISAFLLTLVLYFWEAAQDSLVGRLERVAQSRSILVWIYTVGVTLWAFVLWLANEFIGRGWFDDLQERTVREQTADLPEGNYLFLRCSGDEAAAALSFAQFIVWASVRAYSVAQRLLKPLWMGGAIARLAFVFVFLWILPSSTFRSIAFFRPLVETDQHGVTIFWQILKYYGGVSSIALVLSVFAVAALPFLFWFGAFGAFSIFVSQAAMARAFGWTSLAAGFLVELAIEPLPFGAHSLVHIDWNSNETKQLRGIVHSWTYEHPVAITRLEDWVRSECAN